MRARTHWKTTIPDKHLFVVLELLGWVPRDQDAADVKGHRDRIIADLPAPVQADARTNYILTTYRPRTGSWGIITRDQADLITVRLDHNDPEQVCKTAEDFVASMLVEYPRSWPSREYPFTLVGGIEVSPRRTPS
jgi:hypothetical protein